MAMKNFYPPIMPTSIPTFIIKTNPRIYFQISAYMNADSINADIVQVAVKKQNNNSSAIKTKLNNGSDIYVTSLKKDTVGYYIELNQYLIDFAIDNYYKVQIRFLNASQRTSISDFQTNINNYLDYLSEWSSVCLIRPIAKPRIVLDIFDALPNVAHVVLYTSSLNFAGVLKFNDTNEIEVLESYQYTLYEGNKYQVTTASKQIWQSDVIFNSFDEVNTLKGSIGYNCKHGITYLLKIDYTTNGGYSQSQQYLFSIAEADSNPTPEIAAVAKRNIEKNCHQIIFKIDPIINSSKNVHLILKRSSNDSDFQYWDDLQHFYYQEDVGIDRTIYNDFLIEHGKVYQYQFVTEDNAGFRSEPRIVRCSSEESTSVMGCSTSNDNIAEGYSLLCELKNMSLIGSDTEQFEIKYDSSISNYQYTVVESKTDTLGGKYPFVRRNGDTYYRQFAIGGLITHLCEKEFLDEFEENISKLSSIGNGGSYLDELRDRREKYIYHNLNSNSTGRLTYNEHFYSQEDGSGVLHHKVSETTDDILEKYYREVIIDFLYKNKVRLYRSPTEGNILVKLTGISLTPKKEIDNIVYNFSATAIEVDEYNVQNCIKYGIHNLNIKEKTRERTEYKIGQIRINNDNDAATSINLTKSAAKIDLMKEISSHWADLNGQNKPIINFLNWVRIQFDSPPSKIYICRSLVGEQPIYLIDASGQTVSSTKDGICRIYKNKSAEEPCFEQENSQLISTIGFLIKVQQKYFVIPPHGYYELADLDTQIENFDIIIDSWEDTYKVKATIDFEANVASISYLNTLYAKLQYYVVGQLNRYNYDYTSNQDILKIVQKSVGSDIITPDNKIIKTVVGFSYLSIEGQPYTQILIKESTDPVVEEHRLNSTGVLTLVCDNSYIEYFRVETGRATASNENFNVQYDRKTGTPDNNLIVYNDKFYNDILINYVALVDGGLYV